MLEHIMFLFDFIGKKVDPEKDMIPSTGSEQTIPETIKVKYKGLF